MKRIICMLALLAYTLAMQAQTNIDSLVNVLNTHTLTSDEKVLVYRKIVSSYLRGDYEKCIEYATAGLSFVEKAGDASAPAWFNQVMGVVYYYKASFDTARIYLEKSLSLAIETDDKKQEALVYSDMGSMYKLQGNYALAIEYYMKSIPVFEELGEDDFYGRNLANIGIIHHTLKNNDRAIYFLEQAKSIAEEKDLPYLKVGVYHALGTIYSDREEHAKCMDMMRKTLELSRSIGDKQSEILATTSMALEYFRGFKDYDKALEYGKESLRLAEALGSQRQIVAAWNTLAEVYRERREYANCQEAALKAWEIDSTSLEGATNLALNISLSNIFLGDKEKAAEFFWKFYHLKDLHTEKNSHQALIEMEVKYETEKKETRISSLERERSLYAWLGITIFVILLLAFGLLFFSHRLNVQKRRLAEQQVGQFEQEKQLVAAQAVLEGENAERSRLARDLHDGLGSMLSLVRINLKEINPSSITDAKDAERFARAINIVDESIAELRHVAHHIMPESLMRGGLKSSLEDFCLAVPGAHFQYIGDDDRLDSGLEILLYRCAHELVNNAMKHAGATHIDVQLMIYNNMIALTVHDDGAGFDPKGIHHGSGLNNIRSRVAAARGALSIHSIPGSGSEITIEI
jgi:signal transduction histidine kinase